MVEILFGQLSAKAIRRGVFTSVPALIAAIQNYLAGHNQDPQPFQSTATTEQILEQVRRGRVTLNAITNQNWRRTTSLRLPGRPSASRLCRCPSANPAPSARSAIPPAIARYLKRLEPIASGELPTGVSATGRSSKDAKRTFTTRPTPSSDRIAITSTGADIVSPSYLWLRAFSSRAGRCRRGRLAQRWFGPSLIARTSHPPISVGVAGLG